MSKLQRRFRVSAFDVTEQMRNYIVHEIMVQFLIRTLVVVTLFS